MATVTAFEAKTRFGELLERVSRGEEVVITRHEDERQTAIGWLRGLRVRIDHEAASLAMSHLSELAATYQLSVYDAASGPTRTGKFNVCGPAHKASWGGL